MANLPAVALSPSLPRRGLSYSDEPMSVTTGYPRKDRSKSAAQVKRAAKKARNVRRHKRSVRGAR
jgi:hypothetical protein